MGWTIPFEVSQAAGGTFQGEYPPPSARDGHRHMESCRGFEAGTCWLRLVDNTYGGLGSYRHTFEVLEITGPLTYTPGSNAVSGSVNLTNETDQFGGL